MKKIPITSSATSITYDPYLITQVLLAVLTDQSQQSTPIQNVEESK